MLQKTHTHHSVQIWISSIAYTFHFSFFRCKNYVVCTKSYTPLPFTYLLTYFCCLCVYVRSFKNSDQRALVRDLMLQSTHAYTSAGSRHLKLKENFNFKIHLYNNNPITWFQCVFSFLYSFYIYCCVATTQTRAVVTLIEPASIR